MATNPKTLFHLVPDNQVAHDALLHPDNKRFVSQSSKGAGLEVGCHVPSIPQGHVITRLGRDADLILRESTRQRPISAIHVAFEINPATHLVLLSVRSKRVSSVTFRPLDTQDEEDQEDQKDKEDSEQKEITGDGVILYAQNYSISIGSYGFELVWRTISDRDTNANADALKALAIQSFETSLQKLQNIRSRDRPTEYDDSEYLSWHVTRLNTANSPRFEEIEQLRKEIGEGAFGKVYKAVDRMSGHNFAIKIVEIKAYGSIDDARARIHREIKVMERLKHKHIIEYLGHQDFHTLEPKIFMPLCKGNLTSLTKSSSDEHHDSICTVVLEHGLSGLDYLASEKLIHRDIKPDNILYCDLGDKRYLFQLADFGLARPHTLATTFCGTGHYQAPELWPAISNIDAPQSPKMDVWSLFASIVAVHSNYPEFPPRDDVGYDKVLNALMGAASRMPKLKAMARLHPDRRASAAQMLVSLFNGKGLTTDRARIPNIGPDVEKTALQPRLPSAAEPSKPRQMRNGLDKAPQTPIAAGLPLIVYPPRKYPPRAGPGNLGKRPAPQPQPIRARIYGGVVKRQAAAGARALNRKWMAGEERPSFGKAYEDP